MRALSVFLRSAAMERKVISFITHPRASQAAKPPNDDAIGYLKYASINVMLVIPQGLTMHWSAGAYANMDTSEELRRDQSPPGLFGFVV